MSLLHLKSGSDIRGTAVGESIQLTDEIIKKIAAAFLHYISIKLEKNINDLVITVGNDSRISAQRIKNNLLEVFAGSNVMVYDCGLTSTPAMFMSTIMMNADAAVSITASHHPYDKNGLKFFTKNGGLDGSQIEEILILADNIKNIKLDTPNAHEFNFTKKYSDSLKKKIIDEINLGQKPLKGFKIVVDAGNGVGGFFEQLLKELGADTTGSQFLEPDGMFPNHIPNPENKIAMSFISNAVKSNNADLGIIFDTDVDRAACVDFTGREINRNALIALASVIALKNHKGSVIVTDSVTSTGLTQFIEKNLGGIHCRFKRGYKNVIDKAIELNNNGIDCPLAMETSGHAALKENYFLDDGAYLMVKIIILMAQLKKEGKKINSLLDNLVVAKEEKEIRYTINTEFFKPYGESLIEDFKKYCKSFPYITPENNNAEGYRVNFPKNAGDGWLLIRMSVHDPVIPINIESNSEGGVKMIENFLNGFIFRYKELSK